MLSHLYTQFTPYEWLLTNRKGGYALGTAFLANLRKYHGLLIAGKEKGYRAHLLSSLEEKISFPSGLTYLLDTNFYPDNIFPQGYTHIKEFFFKPYPVFYYSCPKTNEIFLQKSLRMAEDKNALLLSYHNISSYPFKLFLRPKLTFRNHHHLTSAQAWKDYIVETSSQEAFISRDDLALFLYLNQGNLFQDSLFYYRVYYPLEELRGYASLEDLFSPLLIEVELLPGESLELLFSDQSLPHPEEEIKKIKGRYAPALSLSSKKKAFKQEDFADLLKGMVRDFLIEGDVIAGYPWFYCWGRDTFIGLPALFYLEEGQSFCIEIFENYAQRRQKGLIPNVIGSQEETNYNSLDGTLWFLLRIFEFLEFFKGKVSSAGKKRLLLSVEETLECFLTDTGLPFYVDEEDGLLEIPETTNLALTWMDVVIDGRPLTPRYGKPIEISFLWHNVLTFAKSYLKKSFLKKYKIEGLLERHSSSLQKYFGKEAIADRLFRGEPVFETRPNFVIALSLPVTPVVQETLKLAEKIAREELLTPFGLRTLSPKHPGFKRKYFGNQYQRDLSYHNGSVWVWLLYPYCKLLGKILTLRDYKEALKKLLHPFRDLILSGKVGSLPELYDGDSPFYPKGAPAQFWSVSAILLLEMERQEKRGGLKL
ncbi:hypothetical protein THC_0891 [Caldimicrobium thiodismutans]|uniref:Glycogen debranching protein n=1 Tax=Caldimicrobium thiodismutans TaxID=1653476 RepID=A0A0U5AH59_9BACT|nr:amylo-alpha-1,6-glucosidase [Caldimicrobium thiodismutans]BAU23276.1 hypothetical protein THC_0891 [Caldimicrobium thiodismutans]